MRPEDHFPSVVKLKDKLRMERPVTSNNMTISRVMLIIGALGAWGFLGQKGLYQSYWYLKYGYWPNWSTWTVLIHSEFYTPWLGYPFEWQGLHAILKGTMDSTSIGALVALIGFSGSLLIEKTANYWRPD